MEKNNRFGLSLGLAQMLANQFKGYYDTNTQRDLARENLAEQQRQFNIEKDWRSKIDERTQMLTGEARNRTEQELLVDTEVAKNPFKFGKGWRRNPEGKIEPYAYELSADEKKKFQNQGNANIQAPTVVGMSPDGSSLIMSDGSFKPLPKNKEIQAPMQTGTWNFLSFLPQNKFSPIANQSKPWKMPMAFWSFATRGKENNELQFSPYFDKEKNEMVYPPGYGEWMKNRERGLENDYTLLMPFGAMWMGQSVAPLLEALKRGK